MTAIFLEVSGNTYVMVVYASPPLSASLLIKSQLNKLQKALEAEQNAHAKAIAEVVALHCYRYRYRYKP
jgi:predicted NAD/FAD-dependent oxidoreductase